MRGFLLAALALLLAGCGGGAEAESGGVAVEPPATAPAPAVGRALTELVEAARRGDDDGMWALLSPQTQAALGPTRGEFSGGLAGDLRNGPGTLVDYRVVLSRRVGRWGVATVAGERVSDGEREPYAYAAAFRLVDGRWRVELGGLAPGALEPSPLAETDAAPDLAGRMDGSGPVVDAFLWLDGEARRAERRDEGPFSARLVAEPPPSGLSPGLHAATLFATTPATAAASAWPFEVVED